MLRAVNAVSLILLSLATATPAIERPYADNFGPDVEFSLAQHRLGDYSQVVVAALLGADALIEGATEKWSCWLEFGIPAHAAAEWIHSTDLVCTSGPEEYIWPLGEGIFRHGFAKDKILLQGEAARVLAGVFDKGSDNSDVESPISSRVIAWGPANLLRISTLRKSADEGNLKPSVECYTDETQLAPLSCALQVR